MFATDRELPITGGARKRAYVRGIFTAIAPRYDLLNHLLSLNVDRRWRRLAVDRLNWERRPDGTYLDVCSGTMDLAAELANRPRFGGRVIGADFVRVAGPRVTARCFAPAGRGCRGFTAGLRARFAMMDSPYQECCCWTGISARCG